MLNETPHNASVNGTQGQMIAPRMPMEFNDPHTASAIQGPYVQK